MLTHVVETQGPVARLLDAAGEPGLEMPRPPLPRTIAKAVSLIQAAGAASVQVAVMLDKQRRDSVAKADYTGFPIGNDFVVGYGMDDSGRYRGLPYIGKVMTYARPA